MNSGERSCQNGSLGEGRKTEMQLVGRIKIYQDRYIMIYQDHPSPNLDTSVPKQDTPGTSCGQDAPKRDGAAGHEDFEAARGLRDVQSDHMTSASISINIHQGCLEKGLIPRTERSRGVSAGVERQDFRCVGKSVSKFECRLYIFGMNHPSARKYVLT